MKDWLEEQIDDLIREALSKGLTKDQVAEVLYEMWLGYQEVGP